MNDKQIDVNTASKQELFAYARDELGLEVSASTTKDELKHLIGAQLGAEVNAGAPPEADADTLVTQNHKELRKQKKIKIRIHEHSDHPPRIFVSVNGVDFTIKPGAVVEVPEAVVGVLRDAMQTKFTQVRDENTGRLRTVTNTSQAYPFEVVG